MNSLFSMPSFTKSLGVMVTRSQASSFAKACASVVLDVPGGPYRIIAEALLWPVSLNGLIYNSDIRVVILLLYGRFSSGSVTCIHSNFNCFGAVTSYFSVTALFTNRCRSLPYELRNWRARAVTHTSMRPRSNILSVGQPFTFFFVLSELSVRLADFKLLRIRLTFW